MRWTVIAPAILAALMIFNSRAAAAWHRAADAALVAAWLVSLCAVFLAAGWRWGVAGIALSVAVESAAVRFLSRAARG